MKKLFTLLFIVALLFGCSTKESDEKVAEKVEYKNAYADLTDINEIKSEAEIVGIDLSDTSAIYDAAKYIVIATIQSIDGGSNEDLVDGGYVYPYTYGTLSIEKSYKGDLQEGTIVNYTRMGGIIPYSKWYDSLYKSEQEKHDYLAKGINPKYVKRILGEDIEIVPGKTYLLYMEDGNLRSNDEYKIVCWEYGTREVSGLESASSLEDASLKVLNNITGEYEPIEDVIK